MGDARAVREYWIQVFDDVGRIEGEALVLCENDRAAIMLGTLTSSPFGHQVRSSAHFLARFERALAQDAIEAT